MRVRGIRGRGALVGALVATSLLLTGVPAGAEVALGDLVWFPPGLEESRRWHGGIDGFLEQEAGTPASAIVEQVGAVARGDESAGANIVRAVRLASPEAAEEAARTLATRDIGPVLDLGSLGQGFVVSLPEPPGSEDLAPLHGHDGFRVVGRDLVVFFTMNPDDPAVSQGFLDHMAEHAVRFPGSSAPVPGTSARSVPIVVGVVLGGAAVLAAAGTLATRRRRPPPPVGAVGPTSRPWVA